MPPRTVNPSLAQVIARKVEKVRQNLAVATPGVITAVSVGSPTITVSVKPAVHRLVPSMNDEELDIVEEYAVIQNVPVCWPVGSNISIKGTLRVGDSVLLVAMDRAIGNWRRSGEASEPEDARVHEWGSCVAIPGLVPDTSPFTEPTDAAALASKMDAFLRSVSGLVDATSAPTAITAIQAVIVAARLLVGGSSGVPGTGTTASNVLKVSD